MQGNLTLDDREDVVVVRAMGELDVFCLDVVICQLTRAVGADKDVLVDLRLVQFMDTQCLSAIADARDQVRGRHHAFVVTNAPSVVHRLAEVLELTDLTGMRLVGLGS